ncbi:MAG: hypothetical protein H7A24_11425 [Leptospiraceae bacterium]|nr:hypothetical protein [Leptospiraceae bacterium]MCP5512484.1 hypothetical protein [Leptospiraceae bacterium]
MKKYILTDQKTLVTILNRLINKHINSVTEDKKYIITKVMAEKDLNSSTNVIIDAVEGEIEKPQTMVSIMKENKVEIRLKQENPYRNDLYTVLEIIIEPLERSAARASIKNIKLLNLHYAPQMDLTSVLSLYGKTSIITQTIQQFQIMLETSLNQFGYFITKVQVGFYYAADTPLLNALADAKSAYFLRDAYKKQFYTERGFFNPSNKFKPQVVDGMVQSHLLDNVKSILIVPFFGVGNVLLGYVELYSSLPNLGNDTLQKEIESANGIGPLLNFIESRCEDFTFELELSYVKEWKLFSTKEDAIDISQDGRGLGISLTGGKDYGFLDKGCKLAFSISINKKNYLFYAGLKNIKRPKVDPNANWNLGVRIYTCDKQEGIGLLAAYATQLITNNLV